MTDTRYDNTGREAYVAPSGAGSNVNVTTGDGGWLGNGGHDLRNGMLLPATAATVGGLLGSREQVVVAA